jgi:hypothetical protein
MTDFLTKIGIPLFEDYEIEIYDDTTVTDSTDLPCFNGGFFINTLNSFYILLFMLVLI